MRFFCSLSKILVFLAISIAATALPAQDGWHCAVLRLQSFHNRTVGVFGTSLVAADFDRDGHPDGALLLRRGNSLRIEVYFRSNRVKGLSFTSNLADLAISAVDVNHDGSPDLVVEDSFWHQRQFVWLNDGSGEFSAASVTDYPAAPQDLHPRATCPLTGSECSALSQSSRVRDGHAVGCLNQTCPPPPNPFVGESDGGLTLAHTARNPVRGPPVPLLLSINS